MVFFFGIISRARFNQLEQAALKSKLIGATLDAGRDPLTGLLNRRGLGTGFGAPKISPGRCFSSTSTASKPSTIKAVTLPETTRSPSSPGFCSTPSGRRTPSRDLAAMNLS